MNIIRIAIIVLIISLYFLVPGANKFASTGIEYLRHYDFVGLRDFILSFGIWAPLTSILLMVLQSLVPLVPGLAITITNAWLFGWQYGALYTWLGSLIGAALDFGIARCYGQPIVKCLLDSRHLQLVDTFLRKHGILAIFIARLTPIIPFKIVSYGSGLTPLQFRSFIFATAIGQTPAIIIYSIIGQYIRHDMNLAAIVTLVLVLFSILCYYYRQQIEQYINNNNENMY